MTFLGYTHPSVSATNQLFNIVAIPSGVYRYWKEGRMVWPLTAVVVIGTLPGVFIGALGMITLPELFRALKDWRDAWLGVAMVVMMIARPEGLWPSRRVQMEIREAK